MKLLNIFGKKRSAELECLRSTCETLDGQLQFVTRENESLRKANNRLSELINGYKGRQKSSDGVQKELNRLRKKYDNVCQEIGILKKKLNVLKTIGYEYGNWPQVQGLSPFQNKWKLKKVK